MFLPDENQEVYLTGVQTESEIIGPRCPADPSKQTPANLKSEPTPPSSILNIIRM